MSFLRGPVGLVLPGGGALCSWQAGCLEALADAGVRFDRVLGISAGALNGGAYFAGRLADEMHHWRDADTIRALTFSPRLAPLSLFAIEPVWNLVAYALDDDKVRREGVCDLTVVTVRDDDRATVHSRFTPRGERGWDGPLAARLVASAAIPLIYPPVPIAGRRYRDGGTPGAAPARFDELAGCRDVLVIQPVRPEERGRRHWGPLARHEQRLREAALAEVEEGLDSLRRLPEPPRILRLVPSTTLDFSMLAFTTRRCGPAVERGTRDALAFLTALRPEPETDLEPSHGR